MRGGYPSFEPERRLGSLEVRNLSFEDRLGLLVERKDTARHAGHLAIRLHCARLRHAACIEDIDFRHPRGPDNDLVLSLADGGWTREHLNVPVTVRPRGRDLACLRAGP